MWCLLGGALGFSFGSFVASLDNRKNERTVRQKGWSLAKEYSILGSVFWATECVVEKVALDECSRSEKFTWSPSGSIFLVTIFDVNMHLFQAWGKRDPTTTVVAGCVSGVAIAAKAKGNLFQFHLLSIFLFLVKILQHLCLFLKH